MTAGPDLFAGTEAEDETQLCSDLEDVAKRERFTVHRDSYVTERDFAYLANRRIGAVRIPVPFFVFGDYPPYLGCAEHLDRAFDWAEKYQIKVLNEPISQELWDVIDLPSRYPPRDLDYARGSGPGP